MPADLYKLNEIKERIITMVRIKGPSLPVHIARAINTSPMFTSAFLSELYSEGKIKMSNMKVGSSPIYYLTGQEAQLENFIEFLNHKEKEAFHLLRNNKVLDDDMQEPAIRVALRAIKDFAVPIKVRLNENTKTFWKHFLLSDNEVRALLEQTINPYQKHKAQEKQEEKPVTKEIPLEIKAEEVFKKEAIEAVHKSEIQQSAQEIKQEVKEETKEKSKKKPKIQDFAFPRHVKSYLSSKDIEILQILEEKKKDFSAKIRVDTMFGKQEFYLVAKDKKKVNDLDLIMAHQKAQENKMLALVLAPGELDKKALEHMSNWKNMVKFEKVKL
jgi:hypothetical protein